ncbi:MAG: hypothetical protein ACKOXS_04870, partial [Actinomycetes bacterium]
VFENVIKYVFSSLRVIIACVISFLSFEGKRAIRSVESTKNLRTLFSKETDLLISNSTRF